MSRCTQHWPLSRAVRTSVGAQWIARGAQYVGSLCAEGLHLLQNNEAQTARQNHFGAAARTHGSGAGRAKGAAGRDSEIGQGGPVGLSTRAAAPFQRGP